MVRRAAATALEQRWKGAAFRGLLLQLALRILLAAFIFFALFLQPPETYRWPYALLWIGYLVAIAGWGFWALQRSSRAGAEARRWVALLMLCADVAVVSALSVESGLSSPNTWTSDVLHYGLFLIPLIAAAQLDPFVSAVIAVPTVAAYVVVLWVNQEANGDEPWGSILTTTALLFGLAAGSVTLSWIQQSKEQTIARLAQERSHLLEEIVTLEKRERQTLSERLHDGALQYVLASRREMEEVREGSAESMDRVDMALGECSRLLRDVVRELHPEVLARAGLRAAITSLADGIAARTNLAVHLDFDNWPEDLRTDADHLLYSAAREFSTNAIKHAKADNLRFTLARSDARATLCVADDGVGIQPERLALSLETGHIGFASIRAKVLALGGVLDVHDARGTEIAITLPSPAAV
ncbi:histidine kinase [Mycobacterium sp. NS-7484]|uniref:sensor histidine kinase n=1 Tax=Mycobacterium sp. NS-7484 TaxID=1834161 RepID=UPI00096C7C5A|nr:ATP-binding protein [Mycobacterium sp. NS-7484]OMB93055.1 histidine kinase [Mycobacterium sp. NS-7484]